MPYIFGALLVVNIVLFGYFWATSDNPDNSVEQARAELQKPIEVKNTSNEIPPQIGEK